MLCPRCGHEAQDTYRYCTECWLEVNPTGEEADFRVGLMRGDWERRHPERVAEYESWAAHHGDTAERSPGMPPPPSPPGKLAPITRGVPPQRLCPSSPSTAA